MWGARLEHQQEKYLSLPLIVGKPRNKAFKKIKQKVLLKLQGWKEHLLSQGGREVLLKAVALAIPNYLMSCFLLPDQLIKELESLMAKFW